VDVDFGSVTRSLDLFTVGQVFEGAVEDRAGNENVDAAAALEGTDDAETGDEADSEVPNLIDFEEEDDFLLTYIFDQDVDCAFLDTADEDPEQFVAYESEGTGNLDEGDNDDDDAGDPDPGQLHGIDVTDCEDDSIEVEFFDDVTDVDRVAVDPNPRQSEADPDDASNVCVDGDDDECSGHDHAGDETDDPDLESVTRTDDDEFLFLFDEDIEGVSADKFYIDEVNGDTHTAVACDEEDDSGVECSFDDLEDVENADLALGAVDECAVNDDDPDDDCNTIGAQPLEFDEGVGPEGDSGGDPGGTNAPDLEECEVEDPEDFLVALIFDENLDDDFVTPTASVNIFDADGNMSSSSDIDDTEGNRVVAEFDEDALEDAVGCQNDDGAVADEAANEATMASVGLTGAPGTSTVTTTTTGTGTVTTTTTGTGGTVTTTPDGGDERVETAVTIRYNRKGRAFKGQVAADRNQCSRARLVKLKKKGKGTVGQDTTNDRGNWSVRKRRARGRFTAVAPRKIFTAANGVRVICEFDASPTIRVGRRRR